MEFLYVLLVAAGASASWMLLGAIQYRILPEVEPWEQEAQRALCALFGPTYVFWRGVWSIQRWLLK